MNDLKNEAENTLPDVVNKTKDIASHAGDEMAKSGKDWISYIKNHPVQSIFFGIIGYFAIKGFMKD